MAHTTQSRPDSGLDFQVKVLKTFQDVPSSLGEYRRAAQRRPHHPQPYCCWPPAHMAHTTQSRPDSGREREGEKERERQREQERERERERPAAKRKRERVRERERERTGEQRNAAPVTRSRIAAGHQRVPRLCVAKKSKFGCAALACKAFGE